MPVSRPQEQSCALALTPCTPPAPALQGSIDPTGGCAIHLLFALSQRTASSRATAGRTHSLQQRQSTIATKSIRKRTSRSLLCHGVYVTSSQSATSSPPPVLRLHHAQLPRSHSIRRRASSCAAKRNVQLIQEHLRPAYAVRQLNSATFFLIVLINAPRNIERSSASFPCEARRRIPSCHCSELGGACARLQLMQSLVREPTFVRVPTCPKNVGKRASVTSIGFPLPKPSQRRSVPTFPSATTQMLSTRWSRECHRMPLSISPCRLAMCVFGLGREFNSL